MDSGNINKKILESLILVGACDNLGYSRADLFNGLELILNFNTKFNKNKLLNQQSLFSGTTHNSITYPEISQNESWTQEQHSKLEKELLGFYLTYNPLQKY